MNQQDIDFYMETLQECDADYIVDVLELTTEELLDAFYWKAVKHIQEEYL